MNKKRISKFVSSRNNAKKIFTAGPASLLEENITGLRPCFGRNDKDYLSLEKRVLDKIKNISGHQHIARMQGSGSLAIEVMTLNFLYGNVLVINTGYYSDRILYLTKIAKQKDKQIKKIKYIEWKNISEISGKYDWVFACPTETSCGLKIPIKNLHKLSKRLKSKLMLDATGSIGLEVDHDLADVISFSSCKGLFGLTGACFICFNPNPKNEVTSFYLDIHNHLNKKMTGPYHSIASLDEVLKKHSDFKLSVKINKELFMKKMKDHLSLPLENQPLLCTHVNYNIRAKDKKTILYEPRNDIGGSVVCHIGEVHLGKFAKGNILKSLK